MLPYAVKVIVTALVVVAVVELTKRSSTFGAVLASLPFTSLLAFVWIYLDTGNTGVVAALASNIFWLIVASMPLFLLLPVMLRTGASFWLSLGTSCAVTIAAYAAIILILNRAHVPLR